MLRDGLTNGKGLMEKEFVMLLFGEEIDSLPRNRFDGSKEECQIFADIFYGRSFQDESNSCAVLGASISHRDGHLGCHRKLHVNFNLKNLNISSNSSMKGSSGEALALAEIFNPNNTIRSDHVLKKSSRSWAVKLNSRKSSLMSHVILNKENMQHCCSYTPENSEFVMSDSHGYQPVSFRIVESFAHGILSSYFFVNQLGNMNVTSDNVNCASLSYKTSAQQMGANKIIFEANFVTSPDSQESIASGVVKRGSTFEVEGNRGVSTCMNQIALETLKRHPFSNRITIKEMPYRLESYAHGLLMDAGWTIEPRVRRERIRLAFFFRNPCRGIARSSLSGAWKTCGESLLHNASESEKDDQGREWSDVNEFWSDLKNVLAYIDMKSQQQESQLSLIRRWQLLDPFLAVVFIDRKISILQMGKVLRAVKSATFIPDCSEDMRDVNLNEKRKRKSKSLSSKCKLIENYSLGLNLTDYPNIVECDSPASSDLESQNLCDCDSNMLAENELHKQTTKGLRKSSIYRQVSQSCRESDGFSLNKKLVHGSALSRSTEMPIHLERADTFLSKKASSVSIHNGLLKKAHKSKKISVIKEKEVPGGKSRARSKRKHGENSAHSSDESNSDLPDTPCYECLEPSRCLKRQTGNLLSISDSCSHTSKIQKANSIIKTHEKTVKSGNKSARNFNKDRKDIPLVLPEETAVTYSSISECQDGMLLDKLMKFENNANMISSDNHSAVISLYKSASKSKKIQQQCSNSKESFVTTCDESIPKTSRVKDDGEEVFSTTDSLCPVSKKCNKVSKAIKSDDRMESGPGFHVYDEDLLITAIIKKKDFGVFCKMSPSKPDFPQPEALRKMKSQKRVSKLLPRPRGSGGKISMDSSQFVMGTRTVLGWLIDMGVVSLKDAVQFRNPNNHEVIKDGWITTDGILCKCCTQVFPVSGFKAHAGLRQRRPLNLYLKSGESYTLCQLQAWSAEYKLRKGHLKVMDVVEVDQNDDTCSICADGGELICCDNCPSTYHQSCLSAKELPEGSWYCANCICKICNNVTSCKEYSSSLAVFECSQCGRKYHETCIMNRFAHSGDAGSNTWFCGDNCKKVFFGLRSRVGISNFIEDGFSWTILRCNHNDQNVYSPLKIALMAECNSKLAVALTLMEEYFLPMVDPRTGIDMVPHVLYNWRSSFARLNYHGFYSVVLERNDILLSVASLRVHGIKVAEMPLIATCALQRRKGMCRRLMTAIEKMLRSFKVEMIVLSAIPSLVETWMAGFGFSVMNAEEKKLLEDINLVLFPGTILLKKKLCAVSLDAGRNVQFCSTQDESQILASFD